MIIVTGGAGFIGSCLVWQLNELGHSDIVVVDDLGSEDKWLNIRKRRLANVISIEDFPQWLDGNPGGIEMIYHMGACSTTTEQDTDYLMNNNVHYSMYLFNFCATNKLPFVYASSAATYGDGEFGYSDDPDLLVKLNPMNKYGFSKHLFDMWVLQQKERPPVWAGLKFFNVFGPNEYHKGAQASVIFHAFPQIREKGRLKLFKSYRDEIADGEQKRDFVYVKDVVKVMTHIREKQSNIKSGIYNLGTGEARTFIDLGKSVFSALGKNDAVFDWIEMPDDVRNQYQYFTQAEMKLMREGLDYQVPFSTLEDGANDYVKNYLNTEDPYL